MRMAVMFACWQALKDARPNLVGRPMEIWSILQIVKVSTGAEIAKSSLHARIRQNREACRRRNAAGCWPTALSLYSQYDIHTKRTLLLRSFDRSASARSVDFCCWRDS